MSSGFQLCKTLDSVVGAKPQDCWVGQLEGVLTMNADSGYGTSAEMQNASAAAREVGSIALYISK